MRWYPDNIPAFLCPCVMLVGLLSGCGPSKVVYIPPEWHTPPPAPPAPRSPEPRPEVNTPSRGPLLTPGPTIKEKDLATEAEAAGPKQPRRAEPKPPEHLASMHLVDQAKAALAQGKPDQAISQLEQAIQVDVYNGEAFLTLGRAWRLKGSREKAIEFARKAEIIFQDEPSKLKEVYLFQADVYKEKGDSRNADLYRQKASKL